MLYCEAGQIFGQISVQGHLNLHIPTSCVDRKFIDKAPSKASCCCWNTYSQCKEVITEHKFIKRPKLNLMRLLMIITFKLRFNLLPPSPYFLTLNPLWPPCCNDFEPGFEITACLTMQRMTHIQQSAGQVQSWLKLFHVSSHHVSLRLNSFMAPVPLQRSRCCWLFSVLSMINIHTWDVCIFNVSVFYIRFFVVPQDEPVITQAQISKLSPVREINKIKTGWWGAEGRLEEVKKKDEEMRGKVPKLPVTPVQTSAAAVHGRTICDLAVDEMLKLLKRENREKKATL